MKTASTDTKTAKPLGALSLFPREIRNEIYRHSLPTTKYYWSRIVRSAEIYDAVESLCRNPNVKEWYEPNLSVLCLSNAIQEEVMDVIYLNGTFVFQCNREEAEEKIPRHSSIDNMTKIEIFYNVALDSEMEFVNDWSIRDNTSLCYGCAKAGPLDFFRGDTIARKSILIILELCEWWRYATFMTESPLFEALEQLTGFETVTLRLRAAYNPWRWPKKGEWGKLYTGFESLLSEMSESLEPTLGKSSAMSELPPEQIGLSLAYRGIREVVFHPRKHRAAISKAKKDE